VQILLAWHLTSDFLSMFEEENGNYPKGGEMDDYYLFAGISPHTL